SCPWRGRPRMPCQRYGEVGDGVMRLGQLHVWPSIQIRRYGSPRRALEVIHRGRSQPPALIEVASSRLTGRVVSWLAERIALLRIIGSVRLRTPSDVVADHQATKDHKPVSEATSVQSLTLWTRESACALDIRTAGDAARGGLGGAAGCGES